MDNEEEKILKEMVKFWIWLQGLNKFLKWFVYIGAPVVIAAYAIYKNLKR